MPFPYTFPFDLYIPPQELLPYQFEVRDARGNLIRILNTISEQKLTSEYNAPAMLELSVSTTDAGAAGLDGQNEIWVMDRYNAWLGRFRIVNTQKLDGVGGPQIVVTATDSLGQLGEEVLLRYSRTATFEDHLAYLLDRQKNENPLTTGSIPNSFKNVSLSLYIYQPTTLLQALNTLVGMLTTDAQFRVGVTREIEWIDRDADTGDNTLFAVGKQIQSVRRRVQSDAMATRVYPFGSSKAGEPARLCDSGGVSHRWRFLIDTPSVWIVGGSRAARALDIVSGGGGAGYDNPSSLTDYEGAATSLAGGDLLLYDGVEYEIHHVATSFLYLYDLPTIPAGADVYVLRPYLDSELRGAIWRKMITIDAAQMGALGQAPYNLVLSYTDADIAAYTGTKTGATVKFYDQTLATELGGTGGLTDADAGTISATVIVPSVSGTVDTYVYMIFGRF